MGKILFLDLDGTVRRSKSGATFINDPTDQEIIPGVKEALALYPNHYKVGITNQGGVASGKKSLQNAVEEQLITLQLLPELVQIYFCPDFEGIECYKTTIIDGIPRCKKLDYEDEEIAKLRGTFRKPGVGMLKAAIAHYATSVDLTKSLMVGDRPEDQQAAEKLGIAFLWAHDWLRK